MRYEDIVRDLETNYKVNDLNLENSSLVFILESPHVQELKHGVPVAGASGLTMSKSLFGSNIAKPLGLLLTAMNEEKHVVLGSLKEIGVMNVCQIPMQRTAYSQEDCNQYQSFFDSLEKVRITNNRKNYKEQNLNDLQQFILQLFAERLGTLADRKVTLIPCGRFAQKFIYLIKEAAWNENWTLIKDVPHPSYNSWAREQYQPVVDHIKACLGD